MLERGRGGRFINVEREGGGEGRIARERGWANGRWLGEENEEGHRTVTG